MHPKGNLVFSVEGGNFHSDMYCSADCDVYFWTVCQTQEVGERTRFRHAVCFLFSEGQMADVVTGRKNRCPAKPWRDLQNLEIDINLNVALKVSPEPK